MWPGAVIPAAVEKRQRSGRPPGAGVNGVNFMQHRKWAQALTLAVIVTFLFSVETASAKCRGAKVLPARAGVGASSVVCAINRARRKHGLAPLSSVRKLRKAGGRYARDMVSRHYFAHVTPEGRTLADRLRKVGYLDGGAYSIGEALGTGSGANATPSSTVRAWMHSPPHRALLLSPAFREVGIGVMPGTPFGGGGAATYVAEFGARG
jgi:uncharacterized protein YkwD